MRSPLALAPAHAHNIYVVLAALVLITLVRNTLELLGLFTGSTNFCCFELNFASYLNTYTYTLLLLFCGIYIVHGVLRGDSAQLRRLIWLSVVFMAPLFVLVPLVNLGLNYHGPRLPIWLIPGFYLPSGSLVGFCIILGLMPRYIRRIYPGRSYPRIFLAIFCGFSAMFFYTYWLGLWFAYFLAPWQLQVRYGLLLDRGMLIQVYSLTFMVLLLPVYPFFVRSYIPAEQRRHRWLSGALMLLITAYLVWDIAAALEPLHPSLR